MTTATARAIETADTIPARLAGLARTVAAQVDSRSLTPLEEATLFQLLVDGGATPAGIAAMAGKVTAYVTCRMDLLRLIPAGQDRLRAGQVPVGLAWYIARLDRHDQAYMLDRWACGQFAGARAAEHVARNLWAGHQI